VQIKVLLALTRLFHSSSVNEEAKLDSSRDTKLDATFNSIIRQINCFLFLF